MESAAVKSEGLVIPLIDFSKFLNGNPEQRKTTAQAILEGFKTAGFIYLKGLPFSPEYRKHVFDSSAKLFRLPEDEKMKGCWTTPEANRGYSAPGREKVSLIEEEGDVTKLRTAAPDLKESWEIGRDDEEGHPNQWPKEEGELTGFRSTMMEFFDQCKLLHTEVMRAIAVGLDIDERWFDGFTDAGDNTLRLLHYPEVDRNVFQVNPGQVRAGAHSDYGSVTLLFQDTRGGLQVQGPTGAFIDATPIEGTCVVNAGDLLARWSNDTIKSTIHRVVEPPAAEGDRYPPRYSIAYFCNPNFKSMIEAIPGTYTSKDELKYKAISSGDYLVQRLAATY